ncbi:NAD-dependent epimerase/dehydratase family protein [Luteibacter sp. ME-Dv--P-043b]|uniref:NAD-dependent epimerase/dehydratase family protein n=1 Tax=Luteibacter sp. ME-Dv--P-043b TaxID=3040291 RepID=UPI002554D1E4|nr:NAD-dependent epimerase/dehydratase family protein [Luteibacter sp. ME-Dv--P-043b]
MNHIPSQAPPRQVIVSGATGFVGRHLVPLLVADGWDVVAMGRSREKARDLPGFDGALFVPMELGQDVRSFNPRPGALLIHLAWSGLPNYRTLLHLEENLPRSYAFIKQMVRLGASQVLVAGTCLEYGMQNGCLSALTEPRASTPYGSAKDMLRRQLGFLRGDFPFGLQWARLFYMYGDGQNPRSILAQLDAAIDRGDATFDMSGGEQLRDYLPIEEVARQFLAIARSGQEGVFNICSGQPVSIRRLVERHITARNSSITMNLGHYPYPDYEPLAFWGEPTLT